MMPHDLVPEDYYDIEGACPACDGRGFMVVCCDDICQAEGECMHGDGEITCPVCKGSGE